MSIRRIKALETYPVRHNVLRIGRPLKECALEGDMHSTTVHIGSFYEGVLVGVATLLKKEMGNQGIQSAYQLRGMAILENHRKKGIGKILLTFGERLAKEEGAEVIWMNARVSAQDFYRKSGYVEIGQVFKVPNIGPHMVMFKKL
ncbi:MAG: GNAT family N-acetyltransferase [Bacteroidota bacterium]